MEDHEKEPDQTTARLTLILGYLATKDLASQERKVAVLTQLGFSNEEMVKICGATPGVIRTLVYFQK